MPERFLRGDRVCHSQNPREVLMGPIPMEHHESGDEHWTRRRRIHGIRHTHGAQGLARRLPAGSINHHFGGPTAGTLHVPRGRSTATSRARAGARACPKGQRLLLALLEQGLHPLLLPEHLLRVKPEFAPAVSKLRILPLSPAAYGSCIAILAVVGLRASTECSVHPVRLCSPSSEQVLYPAFGEQQIVVLG